MEGQIFDVRRKVIESESFVVRELLSGPHPTTGKLGNPLKLQNISSADFSVFVAALYYYK